MFGNLLLSVRAAALLPWLLALATMPSAAQAPAGGISVSITPIHPEAKSKPEAAATTASPPAHLVVSDDGAYVLDLRARLIWPRCAEGMRWTGSTCVGLPMQFVYADAVELAHARSQSGGIHWRVPRLTELRHLVEKYGKPPGLHPELFPQAPAGLHWTSTPTIRHSQGNQYDYSNISQNRTGQGGSTLLPLLGWAVDLQTGDATSDLPKTTPLAVRLVGSLD